MPYRPSPVLRGALCGIYEEDEDWQGNRLLPKRKSCHVGNMLKIEANPPDLQHFRPPKKGLRRITKCFTLNEDFRQSKSCEIEPSIADLHRIRADIKRGNLEKVIPPAKKSFSLPYPKQKPPSGSIFPFPRSKTTAYPKAIEFMTSLDQAPKSTPRVSDTQLLSERSTYISPRQPPLTPRLDNIARYTTSTPKERKITSLITDAESTKRCQSSRERTDKAYFPAPFDYLPRVSFLSIGKGKQENELSESDFFCIGELETLYEASHEPQNYEPKDLKYRDDQQVHVSTGRVSPPGTDPWYMRPRASCRLCYKAGTSGIRGLCNDCEQEFKHLNIPGGLNSFGGEIQPIAPLRTKKDFPNTNEEIRPMLPLKDKRTILSKREHRLNPKYTERYIRISMLDSITEGITSDYMDLPEFYNQDFSIRYDQSPRSSTSSILEIKDVGLRKEVTIIPRDYKTIRHVRSEEVLVEWLPTSINRGDQRRRT
ncbi:hypothetical protein B7463_g1716, partial [Scytalidium lignicola]